MTIVYAAQLLREAFRKLFGSSLIERLNTDLAYLRSDFEKRLQERDQTIAELRSEKAQLNAMVMVYQASINQRVGIDPTRKRVEKPSFASFTSPPVTTAWQREVQENDERIAKEIAEEEAAKVAKV